MMKQDQGMLDSKPRMLDDSIALPSPKVGTGPSSRGLLSVLKSTTFRSLRHRNYRRYFVGQIVSFTGSWMQSAALMWLLYDYTGDPRWPSLLIVAQVGPTIFLGAWGGGLADRVPKRKLVFITQSIFLVHAVLLTVLIALNIIAPWLVLAFMAVSGVVQAVDLPARLAFLPDLVPREDLINAVGLNSLLFNCARAVGPALAGLIFLVADGVLRYFPDGTSSVRLGAVVCFAFNALSFLAVLVALLGITSSGAILGNTKSQANSIWDGVRYLSRNPKLGSLVLLTLVMSVFSWPLISLLPAYTDLNLSLGKKTYSLLVSTVGAGALLAALTTATFGTQARRGKLLIVGTVVASAGLLGLALTTSAVVAGLGCASVGFGLILYLSTGQSTVQLAVPDDVRGRVMALWAITLSASAPLGHLLAGQAVMVIGMNSVLFIMCGGVLLVTLLLGVLVSGPNWKQ